MMPIPAVIFFVLVSSLATTHASVLGPTNMLSQMVKAPRVGYSVSVSIKPLPGNRRVVVALVNDTVIFSHLDINLAKKFVLIPVHPQPKMDDWRDTKPTYFGITVSAYEPRPFPFAIGEKFILEIVATSSHTWEYQARGDNWYEVFPHNTADPVCNATELLIYGGIDLEILEQCQITQVR